MKDEKAYDWIFCGLTTGEGFFFSHDPFSFGPFEFTRKPDVIPGCEDALQKSASAFSYKLTSDDVRQSYQQTG